MLIGISPVIGPELLNILYRMGHGDELVLTDAFYPGERYPNRIVRTPGISVPALLDGILALINLDNYVPSAVVMMEPVFPDIIDPTLETDIRVVLDRRWPNTSPIMRLERFAFIERTKTAFVVVITGETRKYGNVILKKGVIPTIPLSNSLF